jgi:hypothetical protein
MRHILKQKHERNLPPHVGILILVAVASEPEPEKQVLEMWRAVHEAEANTALAGQFVGGCE